MPAPVHTPLRKLSIEIVDHICAERGVRFTPLRRTALEALPEFDSPVGGHDLIRALERRLGKPVGPPTAYRAVELLLEQGFISRIETRTAFVPPTDSDDVTAPRRH